MDQQTPSTPPQTPGGMPSPQSPIPPTPPSSPAPEHHGKGPLVGTGIILILIIVGGLYVWYSYLNTSHMSETQELPLILGDDREGLPPTSYSDDVNEIEADINATDLNTFEAQVDADLQAAESAL